MTTPIRSTQAGPGATVARDADALEIRLKEARVPVHLQDGIWDIWVENPGRAADYINRLAAPLTVRTKATPGMQSVELPTALAQALTQARAKHGDESLRQILLAAASAEAAPVPVTKTATMPINAADAVFQDAIRSLMKGR